MTTRTRWMPAALGALVVAVAGAAHGQDAAQRCADGYRDGAVDDCQRAVDAAPDDPELHHRLAVSLTFIGAYQRAIRAQERAVSLAPGDSRAHYDLAVLLGFIQEYPAAVEPIDAALELDPENTRFLSAAEVIYTNAGLKERAVEAARRGAALGDRSAMYNLAWYYLDGKGGLEADPDRAFEWMERAADLGHHGALRQMVDIFLEGGFGQDPDPSRAETWAERRRAARERL